MTNPGLLRLFDVGVSYYDRIEISSGITMAVSTDYDPFLENAYIAQMPWRRVETQSIDAMMNRGRFDSGHDFALFEMHKDIRSLIENSKIFSGNTMDELETVYTNPEYLDIGSHILRLISKYYSSGDPTKNQFLTMSIAYPNQTSTAIGHYRNSGGELTAAFMGLHLDTSSDIPVKNLSRSRNRICINIGSTHRFIQVIPFSALEIAERLKSMSIDVNTDLPIQSRIDSIFMETFPDTPVYRIKVNPFEAYVAATDNFIHDGSTANAAEVDIALHFLGHFSPLSGGESAPALST